MMDSRKLQAWATPLTIGAFALSAVTGIMIFFHVQVGIVKVLHEWFSWCLVIGGLFHVLGSWQPFTRHFSRPLGKVIVAVFAVLIVVSFLPLGGGQRKGMPPQKLAGMLSNTPIAAVAVVAAHQPDELIKELASKGILIEGKEQTIREIAKANGKQNVEILDLIF